MCSLTVFTPTYNRAEYLLNCYESLARQKNKNFIWQIVDDGSNDGTRDLISALVKKDEISIEYYWKNNGGKASAINYSLEITSTPLWMCLDSDDYLLDDAIEQILSVCNDIFEKPEICGAFTVRSDKFGKPMKNVDVPAKVLYANQLDIRYKYKVEPEYVQIYKTDIIKQYRFPVFEGEKFVTESWLQDQLDMKYVFKVFHAPIMVCEYLSDGLTNNYYRLIKNNPRGFLDFYAQRSDICKLFVPRVTAAIMYNAVYETVKTQDIPRKRSLLIKLTVIFGKIMKRKFKDV